jgi:hypothetical protein
MIEPVWAEAISRPPYKAHFGKFSKGFAYRQTKYIRCRHQHTGPASPDGVAAYGASRPLPRVLAKVF